jgi:hypothetical protein
VAIRAGNFAGPLFHDVLDPHLFQFRIVRAAAEHRRDGFRERLRKEKIELSYESFKLFARQCAVFDHANNRMILGMLLLHHSLYFFDELFAG